MTAQHHGFAADDLILAFSSDDVLDRAFELPEFSTSITFPGVKATGFHLIDYVAHGWDVARSAGLPFALDEAVLAVALELARPFTSTRSVRTLLRLRTWLRSRRGSCGITLLRCCVRSRRARASR
jgi:hypothetical protein